MSAIIDGGPAFPFKCQGPTTAPEVYYGMSLRDWFAGQALAGILANHELLKVVDSKAPNTSTRKAAADYADAVADCMISARQKGPQ